MVRKIVIHRKKRQGFFSAAVVEAFSGAGTTGPVTLGSLFDYVEATVPDRVKQQHGDTAVQIPVHDVKGYLPSKLELTAPVVEIKTRSTPQKTGAQLFIEGLFELSAPQMKKRQSFRQRSASVNVDCEATAAGSVEFRLPTLAAEFDRASVVVTWVDRSNVKDASADFRIQGDRITGFGSIRGLDRQLLNCPGGGHATLEMTGNYFDVDAQTTAPKNIELKRSALGDSLYVPIPSQKPLVTTSVTLRAFDESGAVVDRLKVNLSDGSAQAAISEGGKFLATTTGRGALALLPASRFSIDPDESAPLASLPSVNPLSTAARAVGQLRIVDKERREITCTGFLVAPDILMTTAQCVKEASGANIVFGDRQFSLTLPPMVIYQDKFALLKVNGRPGAEFGVLAMSDKSRVPIRAAKRPPP